MKRNSLLKSFKCAASGIIGCVKSERNIKIHIAAAVCVCAAGIFFRISAAEWLICLAFFALVISLEIVNTAIESAVDLVTEEQRPLAKKAKDAAAGAVLVSAVFSAAAGLVIFLPKIIGLFT